MCRHTNSFASGPELRLSNGASADRHSPSAPLRACKVRKLLQRRNNSALALTFRRLSVRRFHLVSCSLLPTSKTVSPCFAAIGKRTCVGSSAGVWGSTLSRQWGRRTSAKRCISDIARRWHHFREGPMHEVAALRPAAREQEPRGRSPIERRVIAQESPTLSIEVLSTSTQNGAERDQHR